MNVKQLSVRILVKTGKIILGIFLAVLALIFIIMLALHIPPVQRFVVQKVEDSLEKTLGTRVEIGEVHLSIPKDVDITGIYLEDQSGDTLAYLGRLSVDTDLYQLLNNRLELNSVNLEQVRINLLANPQDSTFNYQFILDNLASQPADTTVAADTTASAKPWEILLDQASFTDVRFVMKDPLSNTDILAQWQTLDLTMQSMQLDSMKFHLDDVQLDQAVLDLAVYGSGAAETDTTSGLPFDLQVNTLGITQSTFDFRDSTILIDAEFGEVDIRSDSIDIEKVIFVLPDVKLTDTHYYMKIRESGESTSEGSSAADDILLKFENIELVNSSYGMDIGPEKTGKYFDPLHLDLTRLNTRMSDVHYSLEKLSGHIRELNLVSDDVFVLQQTTGSLLFTPEELTLDNFYIRTPFSNITTELSLNYPSLENLMSPYTSLYATVDQTSIHKKDLLYLNPALEESLSFFTVARLDGRVAGTFANLRVNNFHASLPDNTRMLLNGSIRNLHNPDNFKVDLAPLELRTARRDILALLPDSLKPLPVQLPEIIDLRVQGSASATAFSGLLALQTEHGNLNAQVKELNFGGAVPSYDLSLQTDSLDVGYFIDQPGNYENLSFRLTANGSGSTVENLQGNAEGFISNVVYNQYAYDSIFIKAKADAGDIQAKLDIGDENLDLTVDASLRMAGDSVYNRTHIDVENADLLALNFSRTPLTIKTVVDVNFQTAEFNRFKGDLAIRNFSVNNGIGIYRVDSLLVASVNQEDRTEIKIDSDALEGVLTGNVDIIAVKDILIQHINRYYYIGDVPDYGDKEVKLNLDFNIKRTELFTEILVPELETFRPGRLKASFNSKTNNIFLSLNIFEMQYNTIHVDTLRILVDSAPEVLNADLTVDKITAGSVKVNDFTIATDLYGDQVDYRFSIADSLGAENYLVKGNFRARSDVSTFHLDHDTLLLAGIPWQVPANNYLKIMEDAVVASDMSVSSENQKISFLVNSEDDDYLRVLFDNFRLSTFGNLVQDSVDVISGTVNGSLGLPVVKESDGLRADMSITGLAYYDALLGDLKMDIDQQDATTYAGDITLQSDLNDVRISTVYSTVSTDNNIKVDINRFGVSTLEPFLSGIVTDMQGNLTADLTVQGDLFSPAVNGDFAFEEVKFRPEAAGTLMTISNERIPIKNSVISFSGFSIKDTSGKAATINGTVEMEDLAFYLLDLDVNIDNFKVVDIEPDNEALYYGDLWISGDIDITGNSLYPKIDMSLKVGEESNVSYIIPETEYNVLSERNVVRFVDNDSTYIEFENPQLDSATFEGMDLTAKLEVTDEAVFNIVIDPITSDQLSVKGNATLSMAINRKGDMQLSGNYTITEGSYRFSFYKIVQRDFEIQEGSSITWSGDPFNARMDIRAFNLVEAPPIDLMINQLPNTDDATLGQYRNRLEFLVYLNIKGKLTEPEISFSLDMSEDDRNAAGGQVYNRIQELNQNESDLNKQVFALLILKRFISNDPLSSQGGYNLEDKARRSVSRILSDQLNRLTEGIDGVDLTFDLESYRDYSGGTATNTTNLELGLSKNLLNDRLVVKIAGSVNVEGGQQRGLADYVGDLVLEYKLTDDGRIRLLGFRRNDFDIINGEIVETGTGLIYVRDYNSFRELFRKSSDKKQ